MMTSEDVGSSTVGVASMSALKLEDPSVTVASESSEVALPADDDIEDVGSSTVGVSSMSALKLEDVSVLLPVSLLKKADIEDSGSNTVGVPMSALSLVAKKVALPAH